MNEPPRFILPSSAAPGAPMEGEAEKTPEGVQYFRVYAALVGVVDAFLVVFGCMQIAMAFTHASGGSHAMENAVSGIVWTCVGAGHLIATLLCLFGGRKPWVHTLGIIVVVLSIMSCCCTPFGIPILIAFNNPAVKRFYSV